VTARRRADRWSGRRGGSSRGADVAPHRFVPQPIENWRTPGELRALVAARCPVLASRTFFFDAGRDRPYALPSNRPARRMEDGSRGSSGCSGGPAWARYQLLLAQRQA
jgi:hypothetical protein